jgi:predicted dehydrogenase
MVFNYRFFDQTVRMEEIIAERGFGKLIQASMFVNYACWSHCIDLLHLFGGRASQVTALAGCTQYGDAVDVSGSFRLANGATGTILGTNGFKFDFPLYRETHDLIGHHSRWDQYRSSFEKSLAAYLDSVRQGGPPPVPGIAGLEELQFEVALRRSIEQNRPVDVQDEFPIDA